MPKLFTIEDLTRELFVSRSTAYKLAHQIKHNKIGRRILIAEDDLKDYLEKNSQVVGELKQNLEKNKQPSK